MNRTSVTRDCWAIAHRGTPRYHPDNTLAGFERAIDLGCDGIEFDVQLSRDSVPVVFHDRTLTRAGGGRQRVHQLDWRELRRLDAGTRHDASHRTYRIPTLEQVLERLSGRTRLLVEIKTREGNGPHTRHRQLARLVADALQGLPDVWVLSFDSDVLATTAETNPQLPRVLNTRPLVLDLGSKLRRAKPLVVDADIRGLSASFGQRVRRGDRELWTYTCNNNTHYLRAREAGAQAIITDQIDWLIERLETT